jgi:RNA polymerase-associated protein
MLKHADTLNVEQKQKAQKELEIPNFTYPFISTFPLFYVRKFFNSGLYACSNFLRLKSMGIDLPNSSVDLYFCIVNVSLVAFFY